MISDLIWEDWLDKERITQVGEFFVHRNYYKDGGQFYSYSTYFQESKDTDSKSSPQHTSKLAYIGDTRPIATGITAFFVCDFYNRACLKSYLKDHIDFDSRFFYQTYFNYCIAPNVQKNNILPVPNTFINIKKKFIQSHIEKEKNRLEESQKYFEECKNAEDEKLNCEIKEYAKGYLEWVENMDSESDIDAGNYVLKNESVILKLFEEYGVYFPGETKEIWMKRWINSKKSLRKVNVDNFKNGNNKHLLLTILHEAHPFMNVDKIEDYVKIRWGLKSYHRDISIYINNTEYKASSNPPEYSLQDSNYHPDHSEKKKIKEILKSEQT
jgi:hypothetical protein